MFRIDKKWFSHTGEDDKIYIQCVPGESKLSQNMLLIKNPQFLPNHDETL